MINLKAEYGARFRITLDESAECGPVSDADRPWLYQIPCVRGHIFLQGEDTLGAWTGSTRTRRNLLAIPGVRLHQDGDRECTVAFAPALFDRVAEIMQPRKRRRLSEEQRAKLVEAGRATRLGSRGTDVEIEAPCPPETVEGGIHQGD